MRNIFLNTMQKFRLKIPYRYQEVVKNPKVFTHLWRQWPDMFTLAQNLTNFVWIYLENHKVFFGVRRILKDLVLNFRQTTKLEGILFEVRPKLGHWWLVNEIFSVFLLLCFSLTVRNIQAKFFVLCSENFSVFLMAFLPNQVLLQSLKLYIFVFSVFESTCHLPNHFNVKASL